MLTNPDFFLDFSFYKKLYLLCKGKEKKKKKKKTVRLAIRGPNTKQKNKGNLTPKGLQRYHRETLYPWNFSSTDGQTKKKLHLFPVLSFFPLLLSAFFCSWKISFFFFFFSGRVGVHIHPSDLLSIYLYPNTRINQEPLSLSFSNQG